MIQEDYVTFEQAKLLKEKGFPQEYKCSSISDFYTNLNGAIYEKPTLSLVQKWLREEKNIAVDIHTYFSAETSKINHFEFTTTNSVRVFNGSYGSYEEALSKGINKALELI